ncbi:hypothetical protein F5878DRAFT_723822 [Lentinula raphanica]|uniref:Uncharacterized protein n=1 Tax=Lentinula raphanica TaxID=153919 RepID=A0AA38PCX5_9AGAR|nr:hypothetical protein F5880DRAFT_1255574 [Lentinula raphanica]KAJ3840358.1 hypothetical protein F5878DRAFT_723822 [Lentinula raphanica]
MHLPDSTLLISFALCLRVAQIVGGAPIGESVGGTPTSSDERKLTSEKRHEAIKSLNQAYIRGYGDMRGPSYAELEPTADEVCDLSLEMWGEESGTNQRKWQTLNPSGAKGLPKTTLDFEFTGAADSEACPPGAPCTGSRSPNDVWKIKSETKKDVLTISIQTGKQTDTYSPVIAFALCVFHES